jgi:phosphoglycolate phosphatase-like HAD superfamily hydrolase
MIGDSRNDIRAAKAAGVDSAAALYGLQPADVLIKEQATYYLPTFKELLTVLGSAR